MKKGRSRISDASWTVSIASSSIFDPYGDTAAPAKCNVLCKAARDAAVARKLAARLLDAGAEVYYLEDQEGGHGVSDPLGRPDLMADRMTFLIDKLK